MKDKNTMTIETIERYTSEQGVPMIKINGKFTTIDMGEKIGETKKYWMINEKRGYILISDESSEGN